MSSRRVVNAKAAAAPLPLAVPAKHTAGLVTDVARFVQELGKSVDLGRIGNATKMLKAERFQLFSDVADDDVIGVIQSQSSSGRFYSCRLSKDGDFSCCTQNLLPCGGLRGALCKHILVLVIGLCQSRRLDVPLALAWAGASKAKKPVLDKDRASAIFLKHKGAEAGTVDWRPTETVPEDFYAL